jgi:Cytochrome c7 and related cytochrome c
VDVGASGIGLATYGVAMPQIFHPSMNTISRVSIFGALFIVAAVAGLMWVVVRSPYVTEAGVVREQPVPFSHKHHVGDVGLDCRYCHTSVEDSSFAGVPPTETCMDCHSQLFTSSAMLAPVRESFAQNKPLHWSRVHNLPGFVYFDHSIHVHKGIGCVTCHGPVNEMPLMWRENTLHMEWCLRCHRHPQEFVRPAGKVFDATWQPPEDQAAAGQELVEKLNIKSKTDCYTCHR